MFSWGVIYEGRGVRIKSDIGVVLVVVDASAAIASAVI